MPDNDMDRADWQNGAEMPPCVDCDRPTTRENEYGESICAKCQDARDEETWMRQQGERVAR